SETGLRVVFDAAGRHVDSGQQAYFKPDGSYLVSAMINRDLTVSVSTRLRSDGGRQRHLGENAPTLSSLPGSQEGGSRLVGFELQVPSGKRFLVSEGRLVRGTAAQMRGPALWAKQSDPRGKIYGPNTKSTFYIVEPGERLLKLQLEGMLCDVGTRAWLRKLK